MGMYTELVFGARTQENLSPKIVKILKFLFLNEDKDFQVPEHPFFKTDRWDWMFRSGGSYYFGAPSGERNMIWDKIGNSYRLSARLNIKNSPCHEIEYFINWISPYLEQGSGARELIGYSIYEEATQPTLYYLRAQ
jgi:hypothetical protein